MISLRLMTPTRARELGSKTRWLSWEGCFARRTKARNAFGVSGGLANGRWSFRLCREASRNAASNRGVGARRTTRDDRRFSCSGAGWSRQLRPLVGWWAGKKGAVPQSRPALLKPGSCPDAPGRPPQLPVLGRVVTAPPRMMNRQAAVVNRKCRRPRRHAFALLPAPGPGGARSPRRRFEREQPEGRAGTAARRAVERARRSAPPPEPAPERGDQASRRRTRSSRGSVSRGRVDPVLAQAQERKQPEPVAGKAVRAAVEQMRRSAPPPPSAGARSRVHPARPRTVTRYFPSISFRIRSTYTGASHSRGPM